MRQQAAKQEAGHRRREHAAREREPGMAQHEPGAERDEHEWPQAERLCERTVLDDVAEGGERHAADRDEEHPQVQEPAPNRHCVLPPGRRSSRRDR
jgi:hypothetical protein